jgi:hypothetical protein
MYHAYQTVVVHFEKRAHNKDCVLSEVRSTSEVREPLR